MLLVVATTTLDASDVIERFLDHVSRLGVHAVFVMDLGSTDSTLEILTSTRWKALVQLVPSQGLTEPDPSNRTLAVAQSRYPEYWCLFCDPDEFVAKNITTYEPAPDVSALLIPRYNVTAAREMLVDGSVAWSDLRYEIVRPTVRSGDELCSRNLAPPWIFSKVDNKVLVRLKTALWIAQGDESAGTTTGKTLLEPGLAIRHYPIRTYRAFEQKIKNVEAFFNLNTHLPADWGWHWRRWVGLMKEYALLEEFSSQLIERSQLEEFLAEGVIRMIQPVCSNS